MVSTRKSKQQTNNNANLGTPQPQRARNKVQSPVPLQRAEINSTGDPDSDEVNYNEEEDSASSVAGSFTSVSESASRGSKKRERLPANLVKQLLVDIQGRGGISKFTLEAKQALCVLCDQRPELYGDRGDDIRKKISKKVQKFRELHNKDPLAFLDVLEKFKVKQPASGTKRKIRVARGAEPTVPVSVSVPTASLPAPVPAPVPAPANADLTVAVPSTARTFPPAANTLHTETNSKMSGYKNTVTFKVDVSHPERNGPALCYAVPDFIGKDRVTEYKGFYILLPIDSRFEDIDEETNWYSGRVLGDHQVVLTVPAWPFTLWPKQKHARFLYTKVIEQVPTCVQKSMHASHSDWDATEDGPTYAEMEMRKWKQIVLDFSGVMGSDEILSSKVLFEDAGDKDMLDYDLIDVPASWEADEAGNMRTTREESYMGFRVASMDANKGRKTTRTDTPKSKLAAKRAAKNAGPDRTLVIPRTSTSIGLKPTPDIGGSLSNSAVGAVGTQNFSGTDDDAMSDEEFSPPKYEDRHFMASLDETISELQQGHTQAMDTTTAGENKRNLDESNQKGEEAGMLQFDGAARLLHRE